MVIWTIVGALTCVGTAVALATVGYLLNREHGLKVTSRMTNQDDD